MKRLIVLLLVVLTHAAVAQQNTFTPLFYQEGSESEGIPFLLDVNRRESTRLPLSPSNFDVLWSPDRRYFVVSGNSIEEGTGTHLYSLDDGTLTRLSESYRDGFRHWIWSPDSTRVAFVSPGIGVTVVNVETGKQTSFPVSYKDELDVEGWSTDGRLISFYTQHGKFKSQSQTELLLDVETGETRQVLNYEDQTYLFVISKWLSPSKIVYTVGEGNPQGFDLLLYDWQTEKVVSLLTERSDDAIYPFLSGDTLYFTAAYGMTCALYSLNILTGEAHHDGEVQGDCHSVRFAPDGRAAYWDKGYTTLSLVENGEIRVIAQDTEARAFTNASWSPDGTQIAFATREVPIDVHIFSLATGEDHIMTVPVQVAWVVWLDANTLKGHCECIEGHITLFDAHTYTEILLPQDLRATDYDLSPDGNHAVFVVEDSDKRGFSLWLHDRNLNDVFQITDAYYSSEYNALDGW